MKSSGPTCEGDEEGLSSQKGGPEPLNVALT